MKDSNHPDFVPIFSSLAGATRLRLLLTLREKSLNCTGSMKCDLSERCCDVGELANTLGLAVSTTSYHLRELRLAGLIKTERRTNHIYCSINTEMTEQLMHFFASFAQHTYKPEEGKKESRTSI